VPEVLQIQSPPPNDAPTGPSNKRAAVETEVDSPPKKKSCSTKDYMRELTECIRERSARDRTREQIDVAECMEILRQDGVQEGSELHFKAMDLFRKSVCRTVAVVLVYFMGQMNNACNNVAYVINLY